MADIKTVWDVESACGDWALGATGGEGISDLQTSMLISLFTDRMAAVDDSIPDGGDNPRGWWGDGYTNAASGQQSNVTPIGSFLWLLDREKQSGQTLQRAYDYIGQALRWLIEDGVVARFDIEVRWVRRSMLGADVVAHKQDGTKEAVAFEQAWNGIH